MGEDRQNSVWGYVLGVLGAVVVVTAVVVASMYFSYSNKEVTLRQQIKAQQTTIETVFDNTWKIISQKAQVADKYKDAFATIYPKLMEGRYSSNRGGAMWSWIQEQNPNFDTSLYASLSNAIEGQRTIFTESQKTLIDLKREHDTLRGTVPGKWFVGSRPEAMIVVVTSTRTEGAFKTGKDDDTNL
jgi:hypothetical protein